MAAAKKFSVSEEFVSQGETKNGLPKFGPGSDEAALVGTLYGKLGEAKAGLKGAERVRVTIEVL